MDESTFFNTIDEHYQQQLPFVIYSKPDSPEISCWLQHDSVLHKTTEFSESGFAFAPFDLNQCSILFPEAFCDRMVFTTEGFHEEHPNSPFDFEHDQKEDHMALVNLGISEIQNTPLEKVVLSRRKTINIEQPEPLTLFKRLFNRYKKAMVYCWYHPQVGLWIGATPELLLNVEGKSYTTVSLAGTKEIVEEKEAEWTPKEIEEQRIVTEYILNEIEPYVSTKGVSSVETIRAGRLWHLKSIISGRLQSDALGLEQLITAVHPTPAVCGFPKAIAKSFILTHEGYQREFYTGFLGELNIKTSISRNRNRKNVEHSAYQAVKSCTDLYVNLRCMQSEDHNIHIYVGGGITKDSDLESEWLETVAKTKTMLSVLF
ncbi:MAG: chorismate-binding protein [Bacteroidota bacterium]